jgi:hypothetical protein
VKVKNPGDFNEGRQNHVPNTDGGKHCGIPMVAKKVLTGRVLHLYRVETKK